MLFCGCRQDYNKRRLSDYVDLSDGETCSVSTMVAQGNVRTQLEYNLSDGDTLASSLSFALNGDNGEINVGIEIAPIIFGAVSDQKIDSVNKTVGSYYVRCQSGIEAEMAATKNCIFHFYKYPNNDGHGLLLSIPKNARVSKNGDKSIIIDDGKIYAGIVFSIDIDVSVEDDYIVVGFKQNTDRILVKFAFSQLSYREALAHINNELSHWSFDKVKRDAYRMWNKEFAKIIVESSDEDLLRKHYSLLYKILCNKKYVYSNDLLSYLFIKDDGKHIFDYDLLNDCKIVDSFFENIGLESVSERNTFVLKPSKYKSIIFKVGAERTYRIINESDSEQNLYLSPKDIIYGGEVVL